MIGYPNPPMKSLLALSLISATQAFPETPPAKFRAQVIDEKLTIGYGVAIADVDGDGSPDILLADADETAWYQNPSWKKHQLTGKLTAKDHVCLCAKDIDGDGKAEVAIGAEWAPADTKNSGAVFALIPPEDRTTPWESQKLHREPTTHRMHWVLENPGNHFLAVLPLHGCNNVNGEGDGIKFLGYRPETDPKKDWPTFLINDQFHLAHNFDPILWKSGDPSESLLVAAKEGVHLLQSTGSPWTASRLTEKGAGEVRAGKLPNGRRFIATIEPMHGNEVVINPENDNGLWSEKRILLDDSLNQGHALITADFLGLGYDQVVAGWREPSRADRKVGLKLYVPTDKNGTAWKLHAIIDDNQMACEDLKTADLNNDGKPDLIASGRASKNLVIYWNER